MVLQCLLSWVQSAIPCSVLELEYVEENCAYHMRRLLAQLECNSDLTDDEWCKRNPAAVLDAEARHAEALGRLAGCVESLPDEERPTWETFAGWVDRKATSGRRVVIIDPVTAMQRSARPWEDDSSFIYNTKRVIGKHGASLVLVSHPRKLAPGQRAERLTLDDLAGGAAYARFAQTILYWASHKPRKATFRTLHGTLTDYHNRTLVVFKARNGPGPFNYRL